MRRRLFEAFLAVVLEESVRNFIPPLLPYAWLAILWLLTWEMLESDKVRPWFIRLNRNINARGRMLSYIIVAVLGAGVSLVYWVTITQAIALTKKLSNTIESGSQPQQSKSETPKNSPIIEIFAELNGTEVPFTIPSRGNLYLVVLNEKRMRSSKDKWVLHVETNALGQSLQWPSKTKMKKNAGVSRLAYRCDVTNHGPTNVLDVALQLKVWFGETGGEDKAVKICPILSPLDAGTKFTFYIINDCPVLATVALSDEASVRAAGESGRRVVHLNLPHRSPIDQIMMFVPSKKPWVVEQPCER